MPWSLSSVIEERKNTLATTSGGAWLWLLELWRDSTNALRYARWPDDLTFEGNTYTARGMEIIPPPSDSGGTTKSFYVTIEDLDRAITSYIRNGEILNEPVRLVYAHRDYLKDDIYAFDYNGLVLIPTFGKLDITLSCGPNDYRRYLCSREIYTRDRCRHKFKDWRCLYSGAETYCDKRLETCRDIMNNLARFGGFPGIPNFRP